MRLKNKIAVVTGGGSGIGKAIATQFATQGAQVVVAEKNRAAGIEAAEAINAAGAKADFLEVDVTDERAMETVFAEAKRLHGRVDILVNNAGGSLPEDGPVSEVPLDIFWRTIKLDLFGTWLGCRNVIPLMEEAGGGSIINIVSFYGLIGSPHRDSYTAAKGAVIALTRSMAIEYAASKIRVNAIAPGTTLTERSQRLVNNIPALQYLRERHLLGFVEPDDIAQMAIYLASEESQRTTGQIMSIDSGLTVA
uniref:SDR family oxidoreductase n=1 Tax=Bosea sp. NBC_00436 TaxID=2969620 RepID=A0A9E8CPA2_9HYPH